jgi:chemotaxis response regulator CheB
MANIDAAFVEQIFDLPQRKRKPNIHHHSQTDNLGRRLEIPERIFHHQTLRNPPPRLKPDSPDNAIGSSSGGPAALNTVIEQLLGEFPLPLYITQHMLKIFSSALANTISKLAGKSCSRRRRACQSSR